MNKGSGKAMLGKNTVCTKAWGCQRKSLGLGGLERGSMWLQVRREHILARKLLLRLTVEGGRVGEFEEP